MAIYATTLDQLVEKVCRLTHDWVEGTATAGSTGTLTDTSRLEDADYFNSKGAYLYLRTGTYKGNYRKITDFGSYIITFLPVVGGNIVAGDTYSIHAEFGRPAVVEMINLAIDMVAEESLFWTIDESTITLVAATYEYNLPTNMMYLYRVTMADSDGDFDGQDPIPPDQYRITHAATPKLHLQRMPESQQHQRHTYGELWADSDLTASRKLRLEGLGSPEVLSADTDTCPISPAYVVFQAAALLHGSRITNPATDPDYHRVQAEVWQARADIERAKIVPVQLPPNAKRIRE